MPLALTDEQVKRFEKDGFLFPYDVYASESATVSHAVSPLSQTRDGMNDLDRSDEVGGRK